MIPVFGLSLLFSIALCVHVVRTRQEMWWLLIILMLQPLGGIVYLVAVVLPGAFGSTTARRAGAAARAQLDPGRDYREAAADLSQAPTVQNQMRLAKAAASLDRHEEAERLYAQAAQGIHADDPVLLLGRAQALNELRRYDDALAVLGRLELDADGGRAPQAALAYARAYEGLGRQTEAEEAYRSAVERLPGLEAMARFAAFLARTGRGAQ
ncbi:MAG TPA: hypothetical protein VME40_09290, partial [Caulobacteraceae bacterium]|nr:hypothetical protein [Caulobacteraceae bacterium]